MLLRHNLTLKQINPSLFQSLVSWKDNGGINSKLTSILHEIMTQMNKIMDLFVLLLEYDITVFIILKSNQIIMDLLV